MVGTHWPSLIATLTSDTAFGATERRLERALASAGAVAWQRDIATWNCDLSAGTAALLGLKDDPFATSLSLVHPADREWLANAIVRAARGETPYDFEFRLLRPDGGVEWIRDRGQLERDADGQPLRLAGVAQIVTAQKQTEVAFITAFEQAAVGMAQVRLDGSFLKVNDRMCQIMGRSREAMLGLRFQDITHPDDRAQAVAQSGDLLAGRITYHTMEKRYLRPDGSVVFARLTGSLVRDPNDRPDYFFAVVNDISDEKDATRKVFQLRRALDALADSEARLRLSQEGGRIGSWDWNMLDDTLVWSDFQCRQYGFDPAKKDSVPIEVWKSMVHPDDLPRMEQNFSEAFIGDGLIEEEYRIIMPGGGTRWINGRGYVRRDPAGKAVGMAGVDIDVTERRELQDALRDATDALAESVRREQALVAERTAELRRANAKLATETQRREQAQEALLHSQKLEALGQLTAGISHDFNNIVAAISGAFALIERRATDPKILAIAQQGVRAAWRGDALVKQLLIFARQQRLTPRAVDLRALFDEAEPLLRRSIGPALNLKIDCPPDTPPVRVDPVQLESALINLAVNARDAMPADGTLLIAVRNCPHDMPARPPELAGNDATVIDITDTGCGMPPDVLQRVVEPFFTTKAAGKGTGLGLAMVHGFTQASGGALRIVSREGLGTTVSLFLPRVGDDAVRPPPAKPAPPAANLPQQGDATILLVDDDDLVRDILSSQLSDFGYTIIEAANGQEALLAIDRTPEIDLVLTDVTMPGMDGSKLAAAILGRRPSLPILFMTGHSDLPRLVGKAVIEKPFGAERLIQQVHGMLTRGPPIPDPEEAALDSLERRLRSDLLVAILRRWRTAKPALGLPRFADFDLANDVDRDHLVVVAVDARRLPMTFTVEQIGSALNPAGQVPPGTEFPVVGSELLGSQEAAYRRCVRLGKPSYEYARFRFGRDQSTLFERLLLPFGDDAGSVRKLLAVVVIDGIAAKPEGRTTT